MSINNLNPGPVPMPQIAHPATGPIYMIANHHQHPFAYFFQRPYMEAPHTMQTPQALQAAQAIHHRMIQPQLQQPSPQQQPQHQQLQLPSQQHLTNNNHHQQLQLPPPPQPRQVQVQPPAQSKDQTNSKIKNIKEKCLTHYIDGQLIIETSKPLAEKKPKSAKKKKLHSQNNNHDNSNNNSIQSINNNSTHLHNHPQQQQQQHQMHTSQPVAIHQPPVPALPQIQSQPVQARNTPPTPIHRLPQPIVQALPQPSPKSQSLQPPPQQQIQVPQQPMPPAKTATKQPQSIKNPNTGLNEVQRLRAEMPNWSVAEVVEFIERHEDIRQYSSKFAEDEVDGKALLLMIDRNLNFQMLTLMFKHGPAMKIEATLSKYKLND